MGLLDDFAAALPNLLPDDPDKREAAKMGLLNFGATMMANANHGFGASLGSGIVNGAQAYQSGIKDALELQQKRMQGAWQKQLMGELSGNPAGSVSAPQAALAQGAQAGSIGPTVQNAALITPNAPTPQSSGPSLKTMQVGALLGMKNIEPMFNMLKYQQDGIERKPGSFYRNPTTGQEEYVSDPTKGFSYDINTKTVTPIAGYNSTIADQEGAKTTAQEAAKSKFALLPTSYVGADGRPIGGTIGEYIGNQGAPTPQTQPRPVATRSAAPQNFPSVSPVEQQGRDAEAYKIIKAEYDAEKDPTNKAALGRELFRLSGSASAGRPLLQSEAEREKLVGGVKVQNSVEEARLKDTQARTAKDARLYEQLTAAIPMARNLLTNATGSGAGALADQTMAFFGKSTKGAQAAQALDTLGGWMTANVPRMEGPQSNIDVLNYQTMAARVADRTQPTEARLAALDVLEKLQNKYAQVNGVVPKDAPPGNSSSPKVTNIPEGAVNMLRANPAMRTQFEAKYGRGTAAFILGK